MSAADCIAEIKAAAGRDIPDDELADLLEFLQRRARTLEAERTGDSAAEIIMAAAEEMAAGIEIAAVIAKRNAALNTLSRLAAGDFARGNFSDRLALGLEALITGVNRLRSGSRRSAAAEQRQLHGYYTRGFLADVEKAGLWRVFVSGQLDREIARGAWALGRPEGPGTAGAEGGDPLGGLAGVSREAAVLARIVHKWQEAARLDANRAGAWIDRMPGYVVRQSHDMFKISKVPFEEWRDAIMDGLDHARTFADVADTDDYLRRVYEALASGVHLAANAGDAPSGFQGHANIAKRMSQDRLLHFKNADAWSDYNARFGTGSLRESLLFGLGRMADQTGLMRVWGPNARANFEAVHRELLAGIRDPKARAKLQADFSWLENRFMEVDGSVNIPGNVMLAKWGGIARAWESMSKLGGAVLASIVDIPLSASELRYQGVGFLESHSIPVQGILQGKATRQQREILGMLGVANQGLAGGVVHRFSAHDDLPGTMSRMMRTFFKYNGLTWWTDRIRESAALAMSRRLAFNKNRQWNGLDPDLKRTLTLFGIDGPQWELLRRRAAKTADGEEFIVPEAARDIPDAEVRGVIGGEASDAAVRRFREDLESRVRTYITDRADFAALEPDARTFATLRRGQQAGTIEGEFFRFFAQFKSFPVAAVQKSVGREIFGRGSDTAGEFLRSGSDMLGLANLFWTTTAAGYLAMSAKDLAKGREPRDPNDPKTWIAAVAQSGAAGIYTDFLFGEARNRFGQTPFSTLLGPAAGAAEDVIDIAFRIRDGDDTAAQAFTTGINNTPFLGLFYTRWAFDYLLGYQVREALNPGYLRRSERRLERENAQRHFIPPSTVIPPGGGSRIFEGVRG